MPAKNPRLSVVVTPAIHQLLSELAELGGQSVSSLVGELLRSSEVPLQRTLAMVRAASQAKGELRTGLAASLDKSLDRLQDALDLEMGTFDRIATQAEPAPKEPAVKRAKRAGGSPRAGGTGARSAPLPPISNKGGKVVPSRGVKGASKRVKP